MTHRARKVFGTYVACVASVSVGRGIFRFLAARKLGRAQHWWKERGGEGRRFLSSLPLPFLALFCTRPNFRPFKRRKMLQTCEKPYTTETLATQARTYKKYVFEFPFNSFLTFHLTADHTCYNNTGETYAGRVNVSKSGRPCRPWPTMDPPGHNFCRNLGGLGKMPWCHAGSENEKEDCDIKKCTAIGMSTSCYY